MPAPAVRLPGRLARWAHVLSYRTISGKLIIGLVLLFGLASAVVSVVTAQSLSNSLTGSLRAQVQSATTTWYHCANSGDHGPGGDVRVDDHRAVAGQPPGHLALPGPDTSGQPGPQHPMSRHGHQRRERLANRHVRGQAVSPGS